MWYPAFLRAEIPKILEIPLVSNQASRSPKFTTQLVLDVPALVCPNRMVFNWRISTKNQGWKSKCMLNSCPSIHYPWEGSSHFFIVGWRRLHCLRGLFLVCSKHGEYIFHVSCTTITISPIIIYHFANLGMMLSTFLICTCPLLLAVFLFLILLRWR